VLAAGIYAFFKSFFLGARRARELGGHAGETVSINISSLAVARVGTD
jgi:hypothetical protein